VSTRPVHETRVVWAFWLACGLVAAGGLVPVLLGGWSSRISDVIIPFWVAAIALGACAILHRRGRPVATVLYLVAGLAIVYGILALLAVPLRLAVIGTCPPAPAHCGPGLDHPLTEAESTGLGFAVGMGIVGILVGFFGLVVIYRRQGRLEAPGSPAAASPPPVRRIPPVRTAPATPPPAPAEPSPEPIAAPPESAPEPMAELPAPEPEPELPAHVAEDDPELPPPSAD
jgi:hypothetical protein